MSKIIIRPSSLINLCECPKSWYLTYVQPNHNIKKTTYVNAPIGTAVHAGIEHMWNSIIEAKDKESYNVKDAFDNANQTFKDEMQKLKDEETEIIWGDLDNNIATANIKKGIDAFVSDIMPFCDIPLAVEHRVTMTIDNPIVSAISGTIDYLGKDNIADVKTSKRKVQPAKHFLQQSIYKFLAESEGYTVNRCYIQAVVFAARSTTGSIEELEDKVDVAKSIVNNLLGRLEMVHAGADPNLLFPVNPSYYFCSDPDNKIKLTY